MGLGRPQELGTAMASTGSAGARILLTPSPHCRSQMRPDAAAQVVVFRSERGVLAVAEVVVVAPYRPTDEICRLPVVPREDVGVQIGIGVAEDLVVQSPEGGIHLAT